MKNKNLDTERKELGMPETNKSFNIMANKEIQDLSKIILKENKDVYLTEEILTKLGFIKETDGPYYWFSFTINYNNKTISFVSCQNDESLNGQYTVRLFDTNFFICKTIQDVRDVISIAKKYY